MAMNADFTVGCDVRLACCRRPRCLAASAYSLSRSVPTAAKQSDRHRHSSPLVDRQKCLKEWGGFRSLMATRKAEGTFTDPSRVKPKSMFIMFLEWYYVKGISRLHPCLSKLVTIAATLPVGSASVERSFSYMTGVSIVHGGARGSTGYRCSGKSMEIVQIQAR